VRLGVLGHVSLGDLRERGGLSTAAPVERGVATTSNLAQLRRGVSLRLREGVALVQLADRQPPLGPAGLVADDRGLRAVGVHAGM